jgi:leucyl aminopeptidase
MKAVSLTLILAYLSVGNALPRPFSRQEVLGVEDGINLDLQDMRLVEMEGQPPVWMTELEKVWRLSTKLHSPASC